MNRRTLLTTAILIFFLSSLTGCSWWDNLWGREPRVRQTPEGLYQSGVEQYKKGDYKKAIATFTRLRDEYPLNPVALQAELGIGDSYFENEQYLDAEVSYGSFVELHMTDTATPSGYEARVFLGHDPKTGRLIAHWLDRFGAGFSIPHGAGAIRGDTLRFDIPYQDGPFRDTFVYRRGDGTWQFRLEAGDGAGGWKPFAEYQVTPIRRR